MDPRTGSRPEAAATTGDRPMRNSAGHCTPSARPADTSGSAGHPGPGWPWVMLAWVASGCTRWSGRVVAGRLAQPPLSCIDSPRPPLTPCHQHLGGSVTHVLGAATRRPKDSPVGRRGGHGVASGSASAVVGRRPLCWTAAGGLGLELSDQGAGVAAAEPSSGSQLPSADRRAGGADLGVDALGLSALGQHLSTWLLSLSAGTQRLGAAPREGLASFGADLGAVQQTQYREGAEQPDRRGPAVR